MKIRFETKSNMIIVLIFITVTLLSGCDHLNKVAIMKNNSNKPIYLIYTLGKVVTDSSVAKYYSNLKEYSVQPDSLKILSTFNRKLEKEPDTSKLYLYIFDIDSLNKYQKVPHYTNLLKYSMIKKMELQLNKIKDPIDTLYINTNR
jgi:hypothetical protein